MDESEISKEDISLQDIDIDNGLDADMTNALNLPMMPQLAVSGLYESRGYRGRRRGGRSRSSDSLDNFDDDIGSFHYRPSPRFKEELRLDVDGRYPQMQASGTVRMGLLSSVHWIARLSRTRNGNVWSGRIWYKDGPGNAMRHTRIRISVRRSWYPYQRRLKATFYGGGAPSRSLIFNYKSAYYHPVEFEYDRVDDVPIEKAITSIASCAHPNRPATIACENLSLDTVYRRAGFDVTNSGGSGEVPIQGAGANDTWSNAEMHDAMQAYWSKFSNAPQWSMWTLFARQHDMGRGLGGIMFDSIGPNHRQGTALFSDSFVEDAPAGDINPQAWVDRMRFWTAAHEMGHAFNLAHSWQKSLGNPWIPLANENEARSFMNYPFFVEGAQASFFSDFEYRFSDSELLFMRHAPSNFVQMGNAAWFDNHGFEQIEKEQSNEFILELRVNRDSSVFEFLEMINLELKLKNVSGQPQQIEKGVLNEFENMSIIIKRDGLPARQWLPFAQILHEKEMMLLDSGKALYETILLSAGKNGWDISEPGNYTVQAMLSLGGEVIVSNPLQIRISAARTHDEEVCAQDIFTKEVGQVLTFGGSQFLTQANEALEEVIIRLPNKQAARQATIARALPKLRKFKSLNIMGDVATMQEAKANKETKVVVSKSDHKSVAKSLERVLIEEADFTAQTLGHINYKRIMDQYSEFLAKEDPAAARRCQEHGKKTLLARNVPEWVFNDGNSQIVNATDPSTKKTRGKKNKTEKA